MNTLEKNHEEQVTVENQKVNIAEFAEMVGFPIELIKKELFIDKEESNECTMGELRSAMLKYLDQTML